MPRLAALLVSLGLLAGIGAAQAQTANTTNPDLQFMAKAASAGHAKVVLGQLALRNSNREDVRQFAQRMVDDHNKATHQLAELAMHEHLRLPRHAEGQDAAEIKRLSALSGDEFDTAYIRLMIEDHRKTIDDYQKEAQQGEVAPIRTLANSTLPMLREHLLLAEQLQQHTSEEKAQAPYGR